MSSPEFSIVTCSIDPRKYQAFRESAQSVFGNRAELILIEDARSLCEGYQRGLAQAVAGTLVFCHDDITFENTAFADCLSEDLADFDLVGVAGTSHLVTGNWVAAGYPHLHGQIIHASDDEFRLMRFDCGRDDLVRGEIQALDGVLFAGRREVFETIGFDAHRFDGFHLYDLDFCFRAHLAGYRLAVDRRLLLVHRSGGSYDKQWRKYSARFNRKHRTHLPDPVMPTSYYPSTNFPVEEEALSRARHLLETHRLPESGVRVAGDEIVFASLASHAELASLLARGWRLGADTVLEIGGPQTSRALWSRDGEAFRAESLSPRAASPEDSSPGFLLLRPTGMNPPT